MHRGPRKSAEEQGDREVFDQEECVKRPEVKEHTHLLRATGAYSQRRSRWLSSPSWRLSLWPCAGCAVQTVASVLFCQLREFIALFVESEAIVREIPVSCSSAK